MNERFENWLNNFIVYLSPDNSDLIPLYDGRISLSDENKPAFFELDERYATKDQIKRMNDLFFAYCADHPL